MPVVVDRLDAIFSALSDPTRRAILERLERGEATVNELAEPFPVTIQAISKHVKVLERAGLVSQTRAGRERPCRLQPAPLEGATAWLERYRRFWEASFDRLAEHVRTTKEGARR